ncbi:MAG: NDP-hexose 2,3-dehydratase family protein, partial [Solobacterium sp.]|nr:NDP-hexose 2,3-dehydratase family protein [Solobacterium sp.]
NDNKNIEFRGLFSEEGGRFYHEENWNTIMYVEKEDLGDLPEGYFWVDFHTLNTLIQFNNCLNIQLRNLISILDI